MNLPNVFGFAEGQPESIVRDIEEMVRSYVEKHLESAIRARIPSIVALINKTIDELEAELDRLGRPIGVDGGVRLGKIYQIFRYDLHICNFIIALL
ncbi:hypothetical protein GW17_00013769 [Ensete ventricosum]|nr:hypothetical protein GW17_00013769 [Ensete ventricosum]